MRGNEERLERVIRMLERTVLEEVGNEVETLYARLHRVTEVAIRCLEVAHTYRAQLEERERCGAAEGMRKG